MSYILLLYDTKEKDLARDFKDLLAELGLDIEMIPSSPNQGKTLQAKEESYLASAEGIIFLITPGSERMGKPFPSPSVADEMGQIKQKFKNKPEKVIYLVDNNCNIQTIDQTCYISFNPNNIRTILEAITHVIKNLKQSGLFGKKKIESRETPGIDIAKHSAAIHSTLKQICFDLSNQPNGFIGNAEFDSLLKRTYKKNNRDINFIKRDLQTNGLLSYLQAYAGWQLTPIGWELVRYEIDIGKKKLALDSSSLGLLSGHKFALLGASSLGKKVK